MYACNCKEWLRSWPKLQNTFTIAWAQDARYEGAAFRNCPWCGCRLRIGFPNPTDEQHQPEDDETIDLPPKKQENYLF
ncbi:MAG: hypothetical protein HUU38_19205 [Anaerolineales bacterium]|nr:hypothetical protein [Anaerolineales bacterium]